MLPATFQPRRSPSCRGRVNEDCSIETRAISLTPAEHATLKASGEVPRDAWTRPAVSPELPPSTGAASFAGPSFVGASFAGAGSGGASFVGYNSGGKTIGGHIGTCHWIPFYGCINMVEAHGSFYFAYEDDEVTGYTNGSATEWHGDCWARTDGPDGSWFTGGLPTIISWSSTTEWDVADDSNCPDVGYGGSMTVQLTGLGDGGTSITCTENFTGPWPTQYSCTPD